MHGSSGQVVRPRSPTISDKNNTHSWLADLSPFSAFLRWRNNGSPEIDEIESGNLAVMTLFLKGVAVNAELTSPAPTNQSLIPAILNRRFKPSELGVGELIPRTLADSEPFDRSFRTIRDRTIGFPASSFPLSAVTHPTQKLHIPKLCTNHQLPWIQDSSFLSPYLEVQLLHIAPSSLHHRPH